MTSLSSLAKPPSSLSPRAVWAPPLIVLAILLVATVWLYRHTAQGMVALWLASDTYAHGFVVPLISLWLVWRIRHTLAGLVPQTSWLAAGLGVLVVLGWTAGDLVAINSITQLALVTLLILWVVALLGWRVARVIAFPLGFLYFAVPIGDFLLPRMMEWTADFTVLALRASGIPVYREGLQFIIPSGSWSVVEACSGIRYLIASVTVGCLFAYLSYRSLTKRLIFVGVAILVPLIANWLRAYMIVMIGHLSGNELATGVDHLVYGWVFFGVVILVMLLIGGRWADMPSSPATAPTALPQVAYAGQGGFARKTVLVALVCLVVALLPQGTQKWLAQGNKTAAVAWSPVVPQSPWQTTNDKPATWKPSFQQASSELAQGFVAPDAGWVGMHLSYYRQQSYERKLVTSSNVLVKSSDPVWTQLSQGRNTVPLGSGELVVSSAVLSQVNASLLGDRQRLLVWRVYWVDDTFTSSDIQAKLRGAWGQVAGRGDDGAIATFYTPIGSSQQGAAAQREAEERMGAFLRANMGPLRQALESTRTAG